MLLLARLLIAEVRRQVPAAHPVVTPVVATLAEVARPVATPVEAIQEVVLAEVRLPEAALLVQEVAVVVDNE